MACIARIIAAVSIPAGSGGESVALTAHIFPVFSRIYNMRSRYFAGHFTPASYRLRFVIHLKKLSDSQLDLIILIAKELQK